MKPDSKIIPDAPASAPVVLFHYSEDPDIQIFTPRPGRPLEGRPEGEELVWAIDENHSPVYFFPRECPRVALWALEGSNQTDVDRWLGANGGRMSIWIEDAWHERLQSCRLYKYTFNAAGFESLEDHGVHVNPSHITPVSVEPVGDLESALSQSGATLQVVPSLNFLADAWFSTLHFSGIRLRNARNWQPPV